MTPIHDIAGPFGPTTLAREFGCGAQMVDSVVPDTTHAAVIQQLRHDL